MAPAAITPEASGTNTPITASASKLTEAGIKHAFTTEHAALDTSKMTYTYTKNPRTVPAPDSDETKAQKTCTDHMVSARWTIENGWDAPELKPYGPLAIMPSASVLHYATECFEGLKLYRGHDGKLRLFRVARNCNRMLNSARRIALPDFDPKELEKMIITLCATDGDKWLPKERAGHFLYIRPTFIATDEALGVQRPREALLYVIIACFPDMSKSIPPALNGSANGNGHAAPAKQGLKLLASNEDTIRAWPGGFGYAKLGANYGPSLVAQGEARSRGFDQVLWLFGQECYVTEAGASNFFVVWKTKEGSTELVTAPLEERIILEGVTRASVLDLAKDRLSMDIGDVEAVEVVEKRFTMHDLIEAQAEGRLIEAFAAGTAFFIAPIGLIHHRGKDLDVPTAEGESGKYAKLIKSWLVNIMYGKEQHEWGVIVKE
ncbi:Branched-chain-amino-acid aminotransferase, mitochondrial [Fulvia fulva]|uniref:Branched-chain-amino-acid aminotransferase n=1 Tax=Passalora fulva TaxID=5499 RepID=A0A9Q8PKL7_PASFU|nr:Branched-chain-amino-acid aminotransferase, mitochondrial [Fulvia fulva]UJO24142.1 Branched-chain-amino-acid aminotransferase, mitochondrial [Fulvia fulva]WPV36951.1 Branched-chain-amino-acid aminotransferase, mitochondrial [Fulvia fulva]